jgi:hypothetical protein
MNQRLFLFLAMGCLGITTEIFFTAITAQVEAYPNIDSWRLSGHSYIWMFPIYGMAGLAFPVILPIIQHLLFPIRMLIYGIGILVVELITGGLLDIITGSCPWEYTTGWHVKGYIRLDYLPFWMLFGGLLEKVIVFLQNLYVQKGYL